MNPSPFLRMTWPIPRLCCLTGAAMAIALTAAAQEATTQRARAALAQEEYETAYSLFQESLAQAEARDDAKQTADQLFYLGLTRQQAAQASSDETVRRRLWAESAAYYRRALELRPTSASTHNNLARVLLAQNDEAGALEALRQAVALPDARQPFYMKNYADLLLQTGRWQDACRFYAQSAAAQPDNEAIHQTLIEVCLAHDRHLLGYYFWDLLDAGQVLQVQRSAFDMLERDGWEDADKIEFLSMIAVCLSRQFYPPPSFREHPPARRLRRLARDPAVGPGAAQLLRLHDARDLRPENFDWWRGRGNLWSGPRRGVWAETAFRQLIRSLASRHQNAGRDDLAEAYYELAAEFNPEEPDTDALIHLAEYYSNEQRLDKLARLMQRHESNLFSAKGAAYSASQVDKIYQFHATLGTIYAHLGQWGDGARLNSAIFHLEHALEVSQHAKNARDANPSGPLQPQLVDLLAQGYEKQNQPAQAVRLRLNTTEEFVRAGDTLSAEQVFRPIKDKPIPAALDPNTRARWEKFNAEGLTPKALDGANLTPSQPSIRVSDQAQSVRDNWDTRPITDQDRRQLEGLIDDLVRQQERPAQRPDQFQILPDQPGADRVKEVQIKGERGTLILEQGSNLLQVPFKINNPALQSAPPQRFIRP